MKSTLIKLIMLLSISLNLAAGATCFAAQPYDNNDQHRNGERRGQDRREERREERNRDNSDRQRGDQPPPKREEEQRQRDRDSDKQPKFFRREPKDKHD